jgi:hypothetical protein
MRTSGSLLGGALWPKPLGSRSGGGGGGARVSKSGRLKLQVCVIFTAMRDPCIWGSLGGHLEKCKKIMSADFKL